MRRQDLKDPLGTLSRHLGAFGVSRGAVLDPSGWTSVGSSAGRTERPPCHLHPLGGQPHGRMLEGLPWEWFGNVLKPYWRFPGATFKQSFFLLCASVYSRKAKWSTRQMRADHRPTRQTRADQANASSVDTPSTPQITNRRAKCMPICRHWTYMTT